MFNSKSIGRDEFVIIATSTCKKDPWIITLNGLFVEPCYDFKKKSKSYATKKMDREAINQIKEN
jgi:hypothetical protein